MIALINTLNQLKSDVEGIKKDILTIYDMLDKNKNINEEIDDSMNNRTNLIENRFEKICLQTNIFDSSNIQMILEKCNEMEFNKKQIRNEVYDILDIETFQDICDLISHKINDEIFPYIIKSYELKNLLHICFKIIDLFIIKVDVNDKLNVYTEKTLFTLCIPLQDSNVIDYKNNKTISANIGDTIIYCGNKENITHVGGYFIIINIEMELFT